MNEMLYKKFDEKEVYRIESFLSHHMANPYSEIYRSSAPLDKRLAEWDKAKSEYLYRLLGDNFILEKPVEYTEAPSRIAQKIGESFSYGGKMRSFRDIYNSWVSSLGFKNWSDDSVILHALISSDCLCHSTLGEYSYVCHYLPYTIDFGNGHKMKFESTTKPMRTLGKLVKMFNLDEKAFEEFRLEHSRICNVKKIQGTLCLSIHPLDYMTMSTNCERWTSCMNWTEPGGYRGGTIEVMNSRMVVVAYLKSDENSYQWFNNQEWNSKKWRLLCIVDPDCILSIKAYPYHHEALARTVIEWLRDLAAENLGWHMGEVIKVPSCSTFEYQDTHTWYNIDFKEGRQMYCDWGCDTHYGCLDLNPEFEDNTERTPANLFLDYCGPMTCMCCGETRQDYYDESYVVCDNCCSYGEDEDCYYCEHCGDRIYADDAYWISDFPYCCDCIDEVAARCTICDEYCYYEDLEKVYLAYTNDKPDVDADEYIYVFRDYCTGRYGTNIYSRWSKLDNPRRTEDGLWYFNREDLTTDGFSRLYQMYGDEVARYFSER